MNRHREQIDRQGRLSPRIVAAVTNAEAAANARKTELAQLAKRRPSTSGRSSTAPTPPRPTTRSTSSTTVLDRCTIPCTASCRTIALADSLVGGLYSGDGIENSPKSTDVAAVRAIDLASPKPEIRTLGCVRLVSPHPAGRASRGEG